jgi:hypothetical protein
MGLLYSWGVSTGLRAVALPFLVSAVGRWILLKRVSKERS